MIVYSPYRLPFEITENGEHTIEIKVFGCRINTFGQVHHTRREKVWWDPGSWRSDGNEWTYEYNLWPQGVLKSPELYIGMIKKAETS